MEHINRYPTAALKNEHLASQPKIIKLKDKALKNE